MKYALISDIHSNLPALEAVLTNLEGRGASGLPTTSVTWSATLPGPMRRSPSWRSAGYRA